jgi:hypothetical protein
MIGRIYLEHRRPVVVLARWGRPEHTGDHHSVLDCENPLQRQAPRNVLVRREDGTLVVRPFRGLRRPATAA